MKESCLLKGEEAAKARRRRKERSGPEWTPQSLAIALSASMMITGFILQTDAAGAEGRVIGLLLILAGMVLVYFIIRDEAKDGGGD